jgi:hypothetical protein
LREIVASPFWTTATDLNYIRCNGTSSSIEMTVCVVPYPAREVIAAMIDAESLNLLSEKYSIRNLSLTTNGIKA